MSFGAEPGRPGEAWAVFVGQTRPSARHRLSTPCPPGRSAGLLHIDAPPGVLHEPRLDAIEMPSAPGRTRMPFQGGGTARERRARHEVMSRGKRMCVPWHRGEIRSDRNRWVTLRAVGGGRLAARGRAGGGPFWGDAKAGALAVWRRGRCLCRRTDCALEVGQSVECSSCGGNLEQNRLEGTPLLSAVSPGTGRRRERRFESCSGYRSPGGSPWGRRRAGDVAPRQQQKATRKAGSRDSESIRREAGARPRERRSVVQASLLMVAQQAARLSLERPEPETVVPRFARSSCGL